MLISNNQLRALGVESHRTLNDKEATYWETYYTENIATLVEAVGFFQRILEGYTIEELSELEANVDPTIPEGSEWGVLRTWFERYIQNSGDEIRRQHKTILEMQAELRAKASPKQEVLL